MCGGWILLFAAPALPQTGVLHFSWRVRGDLIPICKKRKKKSASFSPCSQGFSEVYEPCPPPRLQKKAKPQRLKLCITAGGGWGRASFTCSVAGRFVPCPAARPGRSSTLPGCLQQLCPSLPPSAGAQIKFGLIESSSRLSQLQFSAKLCILSLWLDSRRVGEGNCHQICLLT